MTTRINNRQQLSRAIARLGRLLSYISSEEARRTRSLEYHQRKMDALKISSGVKIRNWSTQRDELASNIFQFVQTHEADLPFEGQSARFDTGSVQYVEGRLGATIFPQGEDAAVEAILSLYPELADDLINTVRTVRKLAFKKLIQDRPDVAVMLEEVVGVPMVDVFSIKPDNSTKPFRRSLDWFRERFSTSNEA